MVAFVAVPEGARQVAARMERTDGLLVAEGTAGLEETEPTHLHAIDLRAGAPEELRMLAGVGPGSPIEKRSFTVDAGAQHDRIVGGVMTEPLSWYTGDSPWGKPIVPPSAIMPADPERAARLRAPHRRRGRPVRRDRAALRRRAAALRHPL